MPFNLLRPDEEFREEDFVPVRETEPEKPTAVSIKVKSLKTADDAKEVQEALRSGSVVLADVKSVKDRGMDELKKTVDRIKMTCKAIEGDLVGWKEEFLVATPQWARIEREDGE